MRRRILLLALVLLAPGALAQNASTDALPVGTGLPGPEESLEGGWGISFGVFVVGATIAVIAVLMFVTFRQRRNPPPEP